MTTREGKLVLTAEDRTAHAFNAVDKRISGVSRSVASANSLFKTAIGTAPVTALAAAAKAAVEHADALGDQARNLGLTAVAYQELSYAAKKLDVDQNELNSALSRFHRVLGDARLGSKEAAKDFRLLNLDPRSFRTTEEAFTAVTKRLGQVEDGMARAAIQSHLFGKTVGEKLAGFVSTAADEVARLRNEAHEVGAVLSEDTIAKADEAATKMGALASVTKAQLTTALVELAPVLSGVGEAFVLTARGIAGAVKEMQEFADGVSDTLAFGVNVDEDLRRRNDQRRREDEARKNAGAISDQFSKQFGDKFGKPVFVDGKQVAGPLPPAAAPPQDPEEIARAKEKEQQAIERLLATYDKLGTSIAKVSADKDRLYQLALKGKISWEQYEIALSGAAEETRKLLEIKDDEKVAALNTFADQAARNIQGITAALLKGEIAGKNFSESLINGLRDIAAEIAAQELLTLLFNAIGGEFGNATLGTQMFKGGRATGGDVRPGMLYEVNERQPEVLSAGGRDYLMMGASGGRVMPLPAMQRSQSSGTIVQIVTPPGAQVQEERGRAPDGRELVRVLIAEARRDVRENGPLSRDFASTFGLQRQPAFR